MWICSWMCCLSVYLSLSNKNDGNLPITGSAHLPFLGFKGKQPHGSLGHSIPLPVSAACASFHQLLKAPRAISQSQLCSPVEMCFGASFALLHTPPSSPILIPHPA